jgi:DNA replication licensing factor MCM6
MHLQHRETLYIDFNHLKKFNEDLLGVIIDRFYSLQHYLRKGVQEFIRLIKPEMLKRSNQTKTVYFVAIYNAHAIVFKMRQMKTEVVGRLTTFRGIVTRTSEIRPILFIGTFRCGECSMFSYNVEQNFRYTTPIVCQEKICGNRDSWHLVREESVYCDWQKARVQEMSDEIPTGAMPRSLDVILKADIIESIRPGDTVVFTGTLIVVPDVSESFGSVNKIKTIFSSNNSKNNEKLRKFQNVSQNVENFKSKHNKERNIAYRLAFLCTSAQSSATKEISTIETCLKTLKTDMNEQVLPRYYHKFRNKVQFMKKDPELFEKLAISIVPHVYGHVDIKKTVLLMLLSGVHKVTKDGVALRGDINILIVGDPSSAKSQILKYVSQFLPRTVYTTGKASTAAGLTVCVTRDHDTHEYMLEPGALILADDGVCCIDEFDKMNDKDQVAIHEAMEQQTISISKAGIQATLNARTSILAAANPFGGRYDKRRTLMQNLNISTPLLSRFDIVHVILDEPNEIVDLRLAEHIMRIHRYQEDALKVPYTKEEMQAYIKLARTYKPILGGEARDLIVYSYRRMRTDEMAIGKKASIRITIRQLEALVRLSEALARLHCESAVQPKHVRLAVKLLLGSIQTVESDDISLNDEYESFQFQKENWDFKKNDKMSQEYSFDYKLPKPKQRRVIAGSKFKIMSQLILTRLRQAKELSSTSKHVSNFSEDMMVKQGIKQGILLEWFIEYGLSIKLFYAEDAVNEAVIFPLIIKKLIKLGEIITSIPELTRKKKESEHEYSLRKEYSTILIVPN